MQPTRKARGLTHEDAVQNLDESIAFLEAAMSPEQWAGVDETCQWLAIDRREFWRRLWLHFEDQVERGVENPMWPVEEPRQRRTARYGYPGFRSALLTGARSVCGPHTNP